MKTLAEAKPAEIVAEYGPFEHVEMVRGVTYDGARVWFASDDGLVAFDPSRRAEEKRLDVVVDAGTAFDGKYLWHIVGLEIRKLDPDTGEVLSTLPAPSAQSSGLAYADGALWVGEYRGQKIHKIDARTGKVLKTIDSDSFVTGVTFADGELWHATMDAARTESEIRRVDVETGAVIERLLMPKGALVSGLEAGDGVLYAGAHRQERAAVRAVRRPKKS